MDKGTVLQALERPATPAYTGVGMKMNSLDAAVCPVPVCAMLRCSRTAGAAQTPTVDPALLSRANGGDAARRWP